MHTYPGSPFQFQKLASTRLTSKAVLRKWRLAQNSPENPIKIGDRVYMRTPTEKQTSTHPELTNPSERPYRVIDISDNSALVTLIHEDRERERVPLDMLRKLPRGIPADPLLAKKTRGKRGRPKKTRHQKVNV
ncbi:hypothetical protein ANCDUO_01577 [Ancylostoma duodenale]|uniref:Uncharacterized protein n=1 Tax=Ancylostoma duodenale TaxID=51022 RepID=A0A0C2DDT2_9BILA|nr:hypothetical protein ANCDUO_01577 [Ancylostoma duodenale]